MAGFADLSEALFGGAEAAGEKARVESRLSGARTQDALARARLRVDEARQRLALKQAAIDAGVPEGKAEFLSTSARAGTGNVNVAAQALGQVDENATRAQIADLSTELGLGDMNRLSTSFGSGGPVDLLQFGPGGELVTELFGPEAGDLGVTPTGTAQIGFDDARAALARRKATNPELFRNVTNFRLPGEPTVSEELLGEDGKGVSVVPEDFNAEEAFGAEAALFTGPINKISDFIGLGTPFEDQALADEVFGNLSARTKLTMLAIQEGGARTSKVLLDLMGVYAAKPRELFNGDASAKLRLENTVAALNRNLTRTKQLLDAPRKRTPTSQLKLEKQLFAVADLVADYESALVSIERDGPATEVEVESGPEVDEEGFTISTSGSSRFREVPSSE